MAFWNSQKSKVVATRKTMARLINATYSLHENYPEISGVAEGRNETRATRQMPVAIFLDRGSEDANLIGFTHDVSLEGVSVVTTREIPEGELFLVIGEHQDRFPLRATCLRCSPIGYGCFQAGIRIIEVLQDVAYRPLLDYVTYLEAGVPATISASRS